MFKTCLRLPYFNNKTSKNMIQSDRLNIMLNTDLGRKILYVIEYIPVQQLYKC